MLFTSLTFFALAFERLVGYPNAVYRLIGHPVTWIGAVIGWLDRRWNRQDLSRRIRELVGTAAILLIALGTFTIALNIHYQLSMFAWGTPVLVILASTLFAQKSLDEHVARVAHALETEGLQGGRRAVSMIVGRDPDVLDEAGVARAAIESLAENYSDGVVAPAFWMAVAGLGGAAAYKAINTADSMIGHRTERHEAFGFAAAKLDDHVNLPASRLAGYVLIAAALFVPGASAREAQRAMWRDAHAHRSPNAGWPEAAMAGALGLALAGPRVYGGVMVEDATMGQGGRREAEAADIRRALRLYRMANLLGMILTGTLALVTWHG